MKNSKMTIEPLKVTLKELFNGFEETDDKGLVAYGGKLIIRPPFQREFIYSPEKQVAVINTILKQRPLNVMYWGENQDDTFELIDGQQRTLSIINFMNGEFSVPDEEGNPRTYTGESGGDFREKFDQYELNVYVCNGDEKEKLEWFQTINIAGEVMKEQELLNATYTGPFISQARNYFKPSGKGNRNFKLLINGKADRQDYLNKTLGWVSEGQNYKSIEDFLAKHRNDDATFFFDELDKIHTWIKELFLVEDSYYYDEMKKVNWGDLYYHNKKNENFDISNSKEFKTKIDKLMEDSDVTNKSAIFTYLIKGDHNVLSIRQFNRNDAKIVYAKQNGICFDKNCPEKGKKFKFEEMEADHIKPWSDGGKTIIENCQMLCKACNRRKSNK